MKADYRGWTIYWGQYGTVREIENGTSTWWADIARWREYRSEAAIGTNFESRDAALAAARVKIDQLEAQ